jgi:hypothetical protein
MLCLTAVAQKSSSRYSHCHRPHLRRLACRALCLEEGHEPGRCREACGEASGASHK